MTPHEATRTLVKSPPEIWAQCSEAEALDRHLAGSFGEIRITRLEPETAVAWEGEQVRGTVRIEPSAWGTRVTLTAQVEEAPPEPAAVEVYESPLTSHPVVGPPPAPEVVAEAPPEAPPEAVAVAEASEVEVEPEAVAEPAFDDEVAHTSEETADPPTAERRAGFWARLTRRFRAAPLAPEPEPEPEAIAPELELEPELEPEPEPEPVASEPGPEPKSEPPAPPPVAEAAEPPAPARPDPAEVLNAALDSLGQAHHRPFSRA